MINSKKWKTELMRRNGGWGCKSAEVDAKTADAGILGRGEPGKNPLPALELLKVRRGGCEGARDLCGWIVAGRVAIFLKVRRGGCVKALFLVTFFVGDCVMACAEIRLWRKPAKKVTQPEGRSYLKIVVMETNSHYN